jgi:hypothetical protein
MRQPAIIKDGLLSTPLWSLFMRDKKPRRLYWRAAWDLYGRLNGDRSFEQL